MHRPSSAQIVFYESLRWRDTLSAFLSENWKSKLSSEGGGERKGFKGESKSIIISRSKIKFYKCKFKWNCSRLKNLSETSFSPLARSQSPGRAKGNVDSQKFHAGDYYLHVLWQKNSRGGRSGWMQRARTWTICTSFSTVSALFDYLAPLLGIKEESFSQIFFSTPASAMKTLSIVGRVCEWRRAAERDYRRGGFPPNPQATWALWIKRSSPSVSGDIRAWDRPTTKRDSLAITRQSCFSASVTFSSASQDELSRCTFRHRPLNPPAARPRCSFQ